MQQSYCELAETKQLRIKHNSICSAISSKPRKRIGETTAFARRFDATFLHRQTMAGAMRFSTRELVGPSRSENRSSAADRALAIELAHFDRLCTVLIAGARMRRSRRLREALAELDVTAALAELSAVRGWSRPIVDDSLAFAIEGGRHPVVEAAIRRDGGVFTANDCDLSGKGAGKGAGKLASRRVDEQAGRIAVVTGPNMAGKSTFLRQNALIVVLAQMGSFVPVARAHVGVVDRLFSRVGAADDLARGRSTFMVEMVETAAILNQATHRSLVILDEIGRGTATFDGLSIAWATMEHLHEVNRARALFATHFHELTQLGRRLARLVNLTMRVTDYNGELVFLHEVVAGAADRSYGIQVARLAGLPETVVTRARDILGELEALDRRAPVERLVADLPLFSRRVPVADTLRVALAAIDPDALSPREAHAALYGLKVAAKENLP